MSKLIASVVLTTVEVICCVLFFRAFLNEKSGNKEWKKVTSIVALIMISTIVSSLDIDYLLKAIIIVLVITISMRGYYRGTWIQIFFCSAGFYGLLIMIDRIMLIVVNFFTQDAVKLLQKSYSVVLLALLCKTILFMAVVLLNRTLKHIKGFYLIRDREWIRFLYFPMLSIVTMLIFILEDKTREEYILFVCIGLLIGNFFLFYMIEDIVKREKRLKEMQIAHERTKAQTEMYIQMNQAYEEQKSKIHECKNHINCIQGLLESDNAQKALEYTQRINNLWMSEMNYIVTNHPIVNAVLNQKYKQTKAEGILLVLSVSNMEGMNLADEDIVTLLTNLLDNAIEATRQVEKEKKMIKCRLTYQDNTFSVVIRNPVGEQVVIENNRIQTTKADKENHGMGMLNVSNVVNKYDGNYVFSCTNGYFTSTVMINQI